MKEYKLLKESIERDLHNLDFKIKEYKRRYMELEKALHAVDKQMHKGEFR